MNKRSSARPWINCPFLAIFTVVVNAVPAISVIIIVSPITGDAGNVNTIPDAGTTKYLPVARTTSSD